LLAGGIVGKTTITGGFVAGDIVTEVLGACVGLPGGLVEGAVGTTGIGCVGWE
jgi:hypothetical protein